VSGRSELESIFAAAIVSVADEVAGEESLATGKKVGIGGWSDRTAMPKKKGRRQRRRRRRRRKYLP